MQYMLLIYGDENLLNQGERDACYQKSMKLARDLAAAGKFVASAPLHPTTTATSVRIREGKRLVTDGPFAETREQLGGYYLVNADNLDEALSIAARIPAAQWGTVEVRPVIDLSDKIKTFSDQPVDLAVSHST
ncbi:MAG TPA: YciI family protein [Bryobacteraceae bacterium]|nr:YciI family protein [Bryobacteraceae bacterium]